MVNKKIVIICTVIACITAGIILYINILNYNESFFVEEVSANTVTVNKNELESDSQKDNNSIQESNITGQEEIDSQKDDNINDTVNNTSDDNKNDNYSGLSNKDKALAMAKKEWGENDSTVYYFVDREDGDTYNISVRSKETTESLIEYEINVKNNTIK